MTIRSSVKAYRGGGTGSYNPTMMLKVLIYAEELGEENPICSEEIEAKIAELNKRLEGIPDDSDKKMSSSVI
jgi:hypothetical protein